MTVAGIITFGGLVSPILEVKLGLGGESVCLARSNCVARLLEHGERLSNLEVKLGLGGEPCFALLLAVVVWQAMHKYVCFSAGCGLPS